MYLKELMDHREFKALFKKYSVFSLEIRFLFVLQMQQKNGDILIKIFDNKINKLIYDKNV